jgi:hypothetical protein
MVAGLDYVIWLGIAMLPWQSFLFRKVQTWWRNLLPACTAAQLVEDARKPGVGCQSLAYYHTLVKVAEGEGVHMVGNVGPPGK